MRWRLIDVEDFEVKGEGDADVENDDVEEEDWSQDRDPHVVRACAIEMHLDVSREPLCARICGKNAGAQNRDADFVGACAVETTRLEISQEPIYMEIYR